MRKKRPYNWLKTLIVFIVIFCGIIFMMDRCFKSNAKRHQLSLNPTPISINWRTPTTQDIRLIGPILGGNGIKGCGVFRVGEYKGETKVACTRDDVNWIYYDIWEATERVNRTPTEQYSRFNTPNF